MISPEIQEQAIRDYCAKRGYVLLEIVYDLDTTGRNFARKGVQRVLSIVEAGSATVAVVMKFNRFGRNRKGWAVNLDRVESAGGRLESTTEDVDTTTSTGKFTRGMFSEIAAWESDRIGEAWQDAHEHRRRNGLPHTGGPRFGYTYHRSSARTRDGIRLCPQGCALDGCETSYVPDPATLPFLAEAYQRYSAGDGFRAVAVWLNAMGSRTTAGGLWTVVNIRRVLDSGFAAGLIREHDRDCRCKGPQNCARVTYRPGAHTAVIEPEVWQEYQRAREARRILAPRLQEPAYVLSGLVRCGLCEAAMSPKGRDVRGAYQAGYTYYCNRYSGSGKAACSGRGMLRSAVEQCVLDWLREFIADELHQDAATRVARQAAKVTARVDRERLRREAQETERALAKLTVDHARGIVPDLAYELASADLVAERTRLTETLKQTESPEEPDIPDVQVAIGLMREWHTLAVSARRTLLAKFVRTVHVKPGSSPSSPYVNVTPTSAPL